MNYTQSTRRLCSTSSDCRCRLAQAVVGELGTAGGHGSSAGGQVRLNGRDPDAIAQLIIDAVLAFFDISPEETQRALLPARQKGDVDDG